MTFNAEGVSNGTMRRYDLQAEGAEQRIAAFYVNGEVLSRLQDSPISTMITLGVGTLPKNLFAAAGVVGDIAAGEPADTARFGLPIVASAPGSRVELPAVDLSGESLGIFGRLKETVSLHFMDYALKSLQTQLNPNGALRSEYLKNVH